MHVKICLLFAIFPLVEMNSVLGAISTDWANDYMNEGLNRLMGQKSKNEYYTASRNYKMPRELRQTLVFDEIDFKYDKNSSSIACFVEIGVMCHAHLLGIGASINICKLSLLINFIL